MQLAPDLSANRNARHDVFWRFVHLIFTSVQRFLTSAAYGLPMRLCAAPPPTPRSRLSPDTMCYGVSSTLSSLAFSVPSLMGSTTSPCACVRLQPTPHTRLTPDTICFGVSSTLSSLAFSVPLLLLPTGSPCACVRLQRGSLVRLVLVSSVSLWWADRAALSGSGSSLRHPALRALRCYALPRPCLLLIAS